MVTANNDLDVNAADLAALAADPLYLNVRNAEEKDVAALCTQAENVLDILDRAREARPVFQPLPGPYERQLAYARYAVANGRRTLNGGDSVSAVAQLADAVPALRQAWYQVMERDKDCSPSASPDSEVTPHSRAVSYRHILVALDGSERAEEILPQVRSLAAAFGSRVTLVRVTTPVEGALLTPPQGILDQGGPALEPMPAAREVRWHAVSYLTAVRDSLRHDGILADCRFLKDVHPAEAITRLAAQLDVDLVALTTRGRSGVSRAILGSVANQVLRSATRPVLLVRTEGHRAMRAPGTTGGQPCIK